MSRILLDECVHAGVRRAFLGHEVKTVPQAGWSGVNNGALLARIAGSFDVFITADKNLRFQQNLSRLGFAIIVADVKDNTMASWQPLFPALLAAAVKASAGDVFLVP